MVFAGVVELCVCAFRWRESGGVSGGHASRFRGLREGLWGGEGHGEVRVETGRVCYALWHKRCFDDGLGSCGAAVGVGRLRSGQVGTGGEQGGSARGVMERGLVVGFCVRRLVRRVRNRDSCEVLRRDQE